MDQHRIEEVKRYVLDLCAPLVAGDLSVQVLELEAGVVDYRVSSPDGGRLVGKGSKTADALRVLVGARAARLGFRANLHVVKTN
jgi:predicted RNA-binding protein YlqC (UPF0109 family)